MVFDGRTGRSVTFDSKQAAVWVNHDLLMTEWFGDQNMLIASKCERLHGPDSEDESLALWVGAKAGNLFV